LHPCRPRPAAGARRAGYGFFTAIRRDTDMLKWALIFLIIALVAAVLGFGGIAGASAGIAKILFFIFLVIFVISLIMHLVRRA
jgi:uncharacterized membrane protein YtjA (UPF0391 family)